MDINREVEMKNLLPGFVAAVQAKIQQYRQKRDALNQVPQFVEAIEGERARMARKFEALRFDAPDLAHEIAATEHAVNQIADGEIARAQASGTVEFDTLTTALRDTSRGIAAAVGKLENRKGK